MLVLTDLPFNPWHQLTVHPSIFLSAFTHSLTSGLLPGQCCDIDKMQSRSQKSTNELGSIYNRLVGRQQPKHSVSPLAIFAVVVTCVPILLAANMPTPQGLQCQYH
jgi:hypothetical protein